MTKDCYSANDGAFDKVSVQVNRKPKMTGLLGYFGVTWAGGAKAVACVERSTNPGVIFPFAMSADSSCFDQTATPPQPILGVTCIIRNVGSVNGTYGALSVDPDGGSCSVTGSGANDLEDNINVGANVTCAVYPGTGPGIPNDYVNSKQGNTVGPTRDGLECRLQGTSGCLPVNTCDAAPNHILSSDTNSAALPTPYRTPLDGIDDIFEIWKHDSTQPLGSVKNVALNDCNAGVAGFQSSPRNVMLIVVAHTTAPDGTTCGGGTNSWCVRGFSRGYLEGCLDASDVFTATCAGLSSNFSVVIRFIQQLDNGVGNVGLSAYGDVGIHLVQ